MLVIASVLLFVASCRFSYAAALCQGFTVQDLVMPVYPPIGRAAHFQGPVKLKVEIDENRHAELSVISGARLISGAAEDFIEARRYQWDSATPALPCEYTTEVEYRLVPGESDERNSFVRVTTLGAGHTLVEAQIIRPTCNDCSDFRCDLNNAVEMQKPIFPPIAKAAHVSGDVSVTVSFDQSGVATGFAHWTGPEMLRNSTENYLRSLELVRLPTYEKSCDSNFLIAYQLRGDSETSVKTVVTKADSSHILVEAAPLIISDPESVITKRKRFLGIF